MIGGWKKDFLFNVAKASWELAVTFQRGDNPVLNEETVFPYLFYFFPKTFTACYSVLSSLKDKILEKEDIVFVELSAGTCSGSAAFLYLLEEKGKKQRRIRIFLQDISPVPLDLGMKILSKFDLKNVEINKVISDATRIRIKRDLGVEPDIVLCSFALYDMFRDSVDDMVIWCDRIIKSLKEDGLLLLIEPALKRRNSLFLMKIRDALRMSVIAPCPHKLDCPILKRSDDWCHFGVRWIPPDYLTRGMYLIGGRPPDINFSYLVFSRGERGNGQEKILARVVSHKLEESGRIRFWTCEVGEKKLYQFLKKHETDKNSDIKIIHMGDLIAVDGAENKGRYMSISPKTNLKLVQKLFDI